MKKLLSIAFVGVFALTGCVFQSKVDELREKAANTVDQTTDAINAAKDKVEETVEDTQAAIDSAKKAKEDFDNAMNSIDKAKEDIGNIGK